MNIHLDIKDFADINEKDILAQSIFGSHLYGLNDENSDLDLMMIVKNIRQLPTMTHHQLQVKKNYKEFQKQDIIVTTLDQFIKNTLSGDSTINFELIMFDKFKGTQLEFIHDFKDLFINYNIIKSYLGMAKRDIKYFNKATSKRDKIKKYLHIQRGILYSVALLDNHKSFNGDNLLLQTIKKSILNNYDKLNLDNNISTLELQLKDLRLELNDKLENNEIEKVYKVERFKEFLKEYDKVSSLSYENEIFKSKITDIFLDYLSKDVTY